MTSSNPIATITNNLGYDVNIYDVFNPNASTTTQGPLKYTKLATVAKGASAQQVQTIRFASQLQAMRSGNITALNNNYYVQFPVAVLPVSPFADSNAFTLTSDMQQGMEDSFKFIKYTQANPTSQLSTNFRTALGDKTSQKNAVNTFFQNTVSFKDCTLTTWTAVFSWQAQFTNPWQGTYYLYSLGSSSTSSTTAPALVATLVIATSAQSDSAVLTMAGTNNQSTSVVMGGDGTMQEQNQGTGNLSVVLTPTWLNITQTSQQDGNTVTDYVIGAAFTGTINGGNVAGNLNQLAIPSSSDSSKSAVDKALANLFSLTSLTQLVGMLTGIGMLYYMAKSHKTAETTKDNDAQKSAKNKADAKKSSEKVEADYQAKDVPLQRSEAAKVESSIVPKVQGGYKQVDTAAEIQVKQSTVQKQINELSDVLEGGAPSQPTEDTAVNLAKTRADLQKAMDPATTPADRDLAMTDASTKISNTTKELTTTLAKQGNDLSQEEETTLSDTAEALKKVEAQADAAKEAAKEQQEKTKNDQDKDMDETDFDDPKAEPPAEFVGGR